MWLRRDRRSRSTGPAKHTQRVQGVPTTRLSAGLVQLEVDVALVRLLEWPPSGRVACALDDIERLGDPVVRLHARGAKVVERPEDVVVPARWERELGVLRIDELAGRQTAQQSAVEQVLLASLACGPERR